MQEQRAGRVVAGLRAVGADAHLERNAVYEFGVAVNCPTAAGLSGTPIAAMC